MKILANKHLTKSILTLTAVLIVSIYSCRKGNKVVKENETQTESSKSAIASASNIPTYLISSPVDSLNQFRRHALGFCNLLSNPAATNNSLMIGVLNSIIIANNETPCRIETLHAYYDNNPTVFLVLKVIFILVYHQQFHYQFHQQ